MTLSAGDSQKGYAPMTLKELAEEYRHSAALLEERVRMLSRQMREAGDADIERALAQRIGALRPILYEMRGLADLLTRYYQGGGRQYAQYKI